MDRGWVDIGSSSSRNLVVRGGARQAWDTICRRDVATRLTTAGWERVILSSFRPEVDFSQTTSIAGPRLDRSRTVATGNPLLRHVLPLSGRNRKGGSTVHHPRCVRPQNSPSLRKVGLARQSRAIGGALFQAQYNLGMADRIACSCVTCPKCGTWVVVRQPTEIIENKTKFRASCPVPECGKGFEFDADETRVFEVPLPLFERHHFYRSELL